MADITLANNICLMFEKVCLTSAHTRMSLKNIQGPSYSKHYHQPLCPTAKVPNSSNRHFYECNCSTSIEGRDDKHLKHILDQNACPTARTEVRNYLATKKGNQALLLQKQILFHPRQLQEARPKLHPQKRKNLFGFVDLLFTPELTTRANFKLFQ
jgi:hypothetical protein